MDRNEIRARELLAAEYDPEGGFATTIICDMTIPQRGVVDTVIALRAISAALRESEELRRDAERYRWLRTNPPNARVWFEHDDGFGADSFEGDDFDAAIDSARGVDKTERGAG